jgi:phosphoglycolate phosphatase-like HAD superfamily hydrolase
MEPLLFDAVVFDLDGTLVATDSFWLVAAERGARRAFAELGLARELPTAAEWMGMVGLPLAQGIANTFGDLDEAQRDRVLQRCVEETHAALQAGGAALLDGALELLRELAARGIQLGIASNCSQAYLDAMLRDLRLGEFVREARCLQSPGIASKSEMLADLLLTFVTRSAVMVGDRASDGAAARANGLPFVHIASGFAPASEVIPSDATIHSLRELVPQLQRRARWISDELDALLAHGRTLGISGRSGSGKSLFARDAARVLRARGVAAEVIAFDAFLRPENARVATPHAAADHLAHAFDLALLEDAVLAPRRRGASTRAGPWGSAVPAGAVLLVEGLFLADPRIAGSLDALAMLEAPTSVLQARLRAREPLPAVRERFLERFLPAQAAFDARPGLRSPTRRIPAANPLGPHP